MIDELTDNELINQKTYIWDSIQNEEKTDKENWNKLCNFTIKNGQCLFSVFVCVFWIFGYVLTIDNHRCFFVVIFWHIF